MKTAAAPPKSPVSSSVVSVTHGPQADDPHSDRLSEGK